MNRYLLAALCFTSLVASVASIAALGSCRSLGRQLKELQANSHKNVAEFAKIEIELLQTKERCSLVADRVFTLESMADSQPSPPEKSRLEELKLPE